jgi:hypothetical protein
MDPLWTNQNKNLECWAGQTNEAEAWKLETSNFEKSYLPSVTPILIFENATLPW